MGFDIRGAFNAIMEKRQMTQFWKQNILLLILKWTVLFLTKRKAVIWFDKFVRPQEKVDLEIPHDLLVLSILFILFITLLFKLFLQTVRNLGIVIYKYVDNKLLTSRAKREKLSKAKVVSIFVEVE